MRRRRLIALAIVALWLRSQNAAAGPLPVGLGAGAGQAMPGNAGIIDIGAPPYNAPCDGATDISSTVSAALATGAAVQLPTGRSGTGRQTCVMENLLLSSKNLYCNTDIIQIGQTVSDISWGIEETGSLSHVQDCQIVDPNGYSSIQTTLAAQPSVGGTTILVATATGFHAGNPITIAMPSGLRFPSVIASSYTGGTTIPLVDAIPSTATSISISGTNAACQVGDSVSVQGGSGPPTTAMLTSVGSSFSGVIEAPGLYLTVPPAGATLAAGESKAADTQTTVTAGAGASSLTVGSTSGMKNGDRLGVLLDSGTMFITTLAATPSGGTLTLAGTLPSQATEPANVYDLLNGQAGAGIHCTESSSGGLTSITGLTATLTTAGPANGATVTTGYGMLWVHNAYAPIDRGLKISNGNFGIQVDGSTSLGIIDNFNINTQQINFYQSGTPLQMTYGPCILYGQSQTNRQVVGMFVYETTGEQNGTLVDGCQAETAEEGYVFVGSGGFRINNTFIDDGIYGWAFSGGTTDQLNNVRATHMEGILGDFRMGVGMSFYPRNGNYPGDSVVALHETQNAIDMHDEDPAGNVYLDWMTWFPSQIEDEYDVCGITFGQNNSGCALPGSMNITGPFTFNNTSAAFPPGGRLSLSTNAVMLGNQVNQSTLYYDLGFGTRLMPIHTAAGVVMMQVPSGGTSWGLDATVPQVAAGGVYDEWMVANPLNQTGVSMLTAGCTGGQAWSSPTGTRTVGIESTYGFWTNSGTLAHCWGGANGLTDYGPIAKDSATLIGSIYATANGQTGWNPTPTPASGGSAPYLYVFNVYNQKLFCATNQDSGGSYTYSPATSPSWREARGSTTNFIAVLDGLAQSTIDASFDMVAQKTTTAGPLLGVGINSNTVAPLFRADTQATVLSAQHAGGVAQPNLGVTYIYAMEGADAASGTVTLDGSNGTNSFGNLLKACLNM